MDRRAVGTAVAVMAAVVLMAACGSSGHRAAPPPSTHPATTSTSVAGAVRGVRTVLSPVGLNVHAQPSRGAKVLGTAAQGAVLTVVGDTGAPAGWVEVKGATVTGWITDDPSLSAPGEFRSYFSGAFNALYPATWTSSDVSAGTAVFRANAGPDNIVSATAPSVTKLPAGRPDYGQSSAQTIVVCGVTSDLIVYQYQGAATTTTVPSALPYLAQVRLALDTHHALGFSAHLTDNGAQLQVFRQFLASVTFPFPECSG